MAPSARDLLTAQVFGAVVRRKDALPDAEDWKDRAGKLPELLR